MQFQEMIDNDENNRRQRLQSRNYIDKSQKDKFLYSLNEGYDQNQENQEYSYEYYKDDLLRIKMKGQDPNQQGQKIYVETNDTIQNTLEYNDQTKKLKRKRKTNIKQQVQLYRQDLNQQGQKTNVTIQNPKQKLAKNTSQYFVRILLKYIDENQNNIKFLSKEETLKVLNEYKGKIRTLNNNHLKSLLKNPLVGPIAKKFFGYEAIKYILKSDKLMNIGGAINSLKPAYLLCYDGKLNE